MIRKLMVAVAVLGFAGSGAIAQGVSFSGSANMGVIYHGKTTEDGATTMEPRFQWLANFDLGISAEGTTDGGLTFGAATSIDGNGRGNGAVSDIDDTSAYIGGESWKITIGDVDPASDKGKLLGDVGYDGLGVDNVAEHIGGADQNVEVSFALGTASLAITFGQEAGMARMMTKEASAREEAVDPTPAMYNFIQRDANQGNLGMWGTFELDTVTNITVGKGDDDELGTDDDVKEDFYIKKDANDDINLYQVNVVKDEFDDNNALITDRGIVNDDGDDVPDVADHTGSDITIEESGIGTNHSLVLASITPRDPGKDAIPAMPAEYSAATKQKTHWATGVSFDVGGTTLGIGIDSNKLMQTSIKADLGAFSGTLFYAQQEKDDVKSTGTGVEIGVSAGENTSINAVYAQGKTGDDTSKGFGVGVSHGLGGGASLAAGFAKVEDQTKASVGVSMSF